MIGFKARDARAGLEQLHPPLVADGYRPVIQTFNIVARDRAVTRGAQVQDVVPRSIWFRYQSFERFGNQVGRR